jgi:hypothetical protein
MRLTNGEENWWGDAEDSFEVGVYVVAVAVEGVPSS